MGLFNSGLIAKRNSLSAELQTYKKELSNCESLEPIMRYIASEGNTVAINLKECSNSINEILIDGKPFDNDNKILSAANVISSWSDDVNNALSSLNSRKTTLESTISSLQSQIDDLNRRISFWGGE